MILILLVEYLFYLDIFGLTPNFFFFKTEVTQKSV